MSTRASGHTLQHVTVPGCLLPHVSPPWGVPGAPHCRTCHAEAGGQRHAGLLPAVLQALPQGRLDEGPAAATMPDRQLQAPHALDDLLLLAGAEEPPCVGHVRHEGHVYVHGFAVHQRRQNPLKQSKGRWGKGLGCQIGN